MKTIVQTTFYGGRKEGSKEILYLMMYSTSLAYSYMASNIGQGQTDTGCPLTQECYNCTRIWHSMAFVNSVVEHWLGEMRISSMGPPRRIDLTTHRTKSKCSYHGATSRSHYNCTRIGHSMAFVNSVVEHWLGEMRNSWMGPPWRIDPTTHRTMRKHSYHRATSRSHYNCTRIGHSMAFIHLVVEHWLGEMRNNSMGPPWRIDPTTHERTLLPRSYISLPL